MMYAHVIVRLDVLFDELSSEGIKINEDYTILFTDYDYGFNE